MRIYDLMNLIPIIFITLATVVFLEFCVIFLEEESAKSSVEEGIIIDKQMNNAGGLFTERHTEYTIVIEVKYEYGGKVKKATRNLVVDRDIYVSCDIGDFFNTHNLIVTENINVQEE